MGTGPLLARAAGRFLRTKGRVVALEVARELQRRMDPPGPGAATGTTSHAPASISPSPSGIRAAVVYYGWLASLGTLALVILNVDQFAGSGTVRTVIRLVLGSILFAEGTLLLTDWQRARTLLLSRFSRGRHHGTGRASWTRAGVTILSLFGLVLFGAGLFDLLRGAIDA